MTFLNKLIRSSLVQSVSNLPDNDSDYVDSKPDLKSEFALLHLNFNPYCGCLFSV